MNASFSEVRAADGGEQPFVGDGDHRVHALAELIEAPLGLGQALPAFELERLGDHGDRQRAELAGQAGDDRGGAGSGAAAEAGGYEHHVRTVERLDQLLGVLERRLAPDVGVGAGAESLGQLRTDLQLVRRGVEAQRLQIRIGDDELDAVEAGGDHAIDGITAAATDAHHFDACARARLLVELQAQR